MEKIPSLLELLKAGVHFGHKTSKRHPTMDKYIFGQRHNVHILDLEKTQQQLEEALPYVRDLAAAGKTILFVGTKKQARDIIKTAAQSVDMPYVTERWLGGTITNFSVIRSLVDKLVDLRKKSESGELEKYTKKEQLEFSREIARLESMVGGLVLLTRIPDAVFVLDVRAEETAMREAMRKEIPVVAVCDTNVSTVGVTKVIPANDDAVKSIEVVVQLVTAAIGEGLEKKRASAVIQSTKQEKTDA
jgi:small subunit ribosomal protein S2